MATQLVVSQDDPNAVPAALAATWLLADLEEFADVSFALDPPRSIVIAHEGSDQRRFLDSLARILAEERFAGWQLHPG
jgi:hypothetical protein